MRAAFAAVLVFLAASNGTGRGDDKKPVKIDGTYVITGLEFAGEKLAIDLIDKSPEADRTIKIDGGKLIANKGGKDDTATFKTDTSKTPHTIDITSKKGDKDETAYGIYKIDGDTLIICVIDSGKAEDRPKEFKTAKDTKTIMMTLKKKKDQ